MNATFCKIDDTRCRANFSGRFFKIFPFRYSVTLNVVAQDNDGLTLSGSSYMGRLFGTFRYQATATDTRFVSHYSSKKDRGKFVLNRSGGPASSN